MLQPLDLIREIVRLRANGDTNVQIAKKLGISDPVVGGLLALHKAGEERLLEAIVSNHGRSNAGPSPTLCSINHATASRKSPTATAIGRDDPAIIEALSHEMPLFREAAGDENHGRAVDSGDRLDPVNQRPS
jgi:hypothetical protein